MIRGVSLITSTLLHTGTAALIIGAAALGTGETEIPVVVAVAPPTPIAIEVERDLPKPLLPAFKETRYTRPIAPPELPLDFQPDRKKTPLPEAKPLEPRPEPKTPPLDRPLVLEQKLAAPSSTVLNAPSELFNPPPAYPSAARRRGQEGMVVVEITILADGTCGAAQVVENQGSSAFSQAALEAVAKWKYRPATRGGRPVSTTQRVRFVFRLQS